MPARPFQERCLASGTYVELVRSLFATLAQTTIMGILFVVVASMAVQRSGDLSLALLGGLGGVLSLVRVAITVAFAHRAGDPALTVAAAVRIERLFGLSYLAFAVTFDCSRPARSTCRRSRCRWWWPRWSSAMPPVPPPAFPCVATEGDRIVAIGKGLTTELGGLAAPSPTEGVRMLATGGRAEVVDCSDFDWIDVDDPAALAKAEVWRGV